MWLFAACFADRPPTVDQLVHTLEAADWRRDACTRAATVGVTTTSCALSRGEQVAVVAEMRFERAADAARSWDAAGAVGWRAGAVVVQLDVFDLAAARSLLAAGPRPTGFRCAGDVCLREGGDRPALRGPAGPPTPGAVVADGRMAVVADRRAAAALLAEAWPAD